MRTISFILRLLLSIDVRASTIADVALLPFLLLFQRLPILM
jgi:hypothetical protein